MSERCIELELPVAISENAYRRYVPGCMHPIISSAGRKFHELVKHRFAESGQRKISGAVAIWLDFYPPEAWSGQSVQVSVRFAGPSRVY